jgi:small subunit ribosomal protein S7
VAKKFDSTERFLRPDPVFHDRLVAKFINSIMKEGKKTVAQKVFYGAMDIVSRKVGDVEPIEVFRQAIHNVKPMIEVRSKRVGGANYQVPVEVERRRSQALAFRWILEAARKKRGRPMHVKLAEELIAAFRREGDAVHKRETVHKMAEANKAFAHFGGRKY